LLFNGGWDSGCLDLQNRSGLVLAVDAISDIISKQLMSPPLCGLHLWPLVSTMEASHLLLLVMMTSQLDAKLFLLFNWWGKCPTSGKKLPHQCS